MTQVRRLAAVGFILAATWTPARAGFMGPYPYLSFSDSTFLGVPFAWFHLEDFEDGAFNTPGVTVDNGFVQSNAPTVDSVDADDGVLDGVGNLGASWTNVAGPDRVNAFEFVFDPVVLGRYPSHVAFVFTDGTPNHFLTFEPFDELGNSLGTLNAFVGDDSFFGLTDEDRFFGAAHETGISRFRITDNGGEFDLEIDHVQYGAVVPEPNTLGLAALLSSGALALAWLRGRRAEPADTP